MKEIHKHLQRITKIKKHLYHPLLHKVHKKHNISKKTLFYVKEYGPHTHVYKTIIKESIKILLLASIISSLGGLAIEHIKSIFLSMMPLIIILPALNDMVGDYGTIISSKFSTLLHEGRIRKKWWLEDEIKKPFIQILIVVIITTFIVVFSSFVISGISGYQFNAFILAKILLITIIDVLFIVIILFMIAIMAGLYLFKKGLDPNNFLIPITTSIADFGNMIILAGLILLFF